MALSGFITKIVTSITKTTFNFNKTIDALAERFKASCPPTKELENLVTQKQEITEALKQIQGKIKTLNNIASSTETIISTLKTGVTIIKQLPIPTSVPPGVGIPINVINNFTAALIILEYLLEKGEATVGAIPEALDLISNDISEVIGKLNSFGTSLDECLNNDPNITPEKLAELLVSGSTTAENYTGIITNTELETMLTSTSTAGLLYGDYYLKLIFPPSEFSFPLKQVTAQNKESVPPPGEFYNPNAPIEMLYGDKSYSSSNKILIEEMQWLIDTKDLIFPPPPPYVDPLKAIYKEAHIATLMAIYQATREEAEELYDLAWDLSVGKGPYASYFDQLVRDAFDSSRSILEQAVFNEGYEFADGDRILDATIKRLFIPGSLSEEDAKNTISLLKRKGELLFNKANTIGGNYNSNSKRWNNDGYEFEIKGLSGYAERLASTAEHLLNDVGSFESLRPEMKKRKARMQAVFEEANLLNIKDPSKINFQDPLKEYFAQYPLTSYDSPSINGLPITGGTNTSITSDEIEYLFEIEVDATADYWFNNIPSTCNQGEDCETSDGLTGYFFEPYAKYSLFHKLLTSLGTDWYNKNALAITDFSFWKSVNQNSAYGGNGQLPSTNKWYFEFGRNGLPQPTGV